MSVMAGPGTNEASVTGGSAMMPRSAASNSATTYGWVERAFHWATAALIATNVVLGLVAEELGFATDAELARKALLFSLHKTVGVTILAVALARIAWALSQPRPKPLHEGWERMLASVVHWLLYGSLVLVPALGWAVHAATAGFAPILWPFGQSLPFVPKDPALAETLARLHVTFVWVLVGSIALHVAGALKHAVIDRDLTLARMWRGAEPEPLPESGRLVLPLVAAGAVWLAALGVGLATASGEGAATVSKPAAAREAAATDVVPSGPSAWVVEDGTLSLTVAQMGSAVTGRFEDWSAVIAFDPEPQADGTVGSVEVSVATGSVTLGSVSEQATAPDFLSSEAFPTAIFAATIRPEGAGYVADGTLSLRGVEVPLRLPFTLQIVEGVAVMAGQAVVDRRDFGMGETYPDESSVGFSVTLDVALTARRVE